MRITSIIATAALASVPMWANATTLKPIEDGETYNLSEADVFQYQETYTDVAETATLVFRFFNDLGMDIPVMASFTVNANNGDSNPDLVGYWEDGDPVSVGDNPTGTGSTVTNASDGETVSLFADRGEIDGVYNLDIQVAAVPLPAGGVLLIGGIAGLAALKRRKKA